MKKHIQFVYRFFSVFIFGLVTCPVMGQDLIPKHLTKQDYNLWSTLRSDKISSHGLWISYYLKYESQQDTLFVKSTSSESKYTFADSVDGRFAENDLFACLNKSKQLHLLQLSSGNILNIPNVTKYDFSADSQFLVTLESNCDQSMNLCIRRSSGKLLQQVKNVKDYKLSPAGNLLLYISTLKDFSNASIITLNRKVTVKELLKNMQGEIKSLTWSKDGSTAAFYSIEKSGGRLFYYNRYNEKLFHLQSLPPEAFPDKIITENSSIPLKISDDNQAVFFAYKSNLTITSKSSSPEIWRVDDKYLYPAAALSAAINKPYLAVWAPFNGILHPLSSEKMSWAALTSDQKYVLLADMTLYEPYYDLNTPMDYYIMEIKTGKKELLVRNQSGYKQHMNFSPDGGSICYYNNNNWIVYDIKEKKHTNISARLNPGFISIIENHSSWKTDAYIFQGWSADSKSILLGDQYDIWQIPINGQNVFRLTHGRELQLRFRLIKPTQDKYWTSNYSGATTLRYDLQKQNILQAYDTNSSGSGYFILNPEKAMQKLILKNAKISALLKASKKSVYIFTSENYDKSPSLLYMSSEKSKAKVLVETNPQQKSFYWGKSEIIHFETQHKESLKGALFYPACYNPSIKYPMIVYIYDKQSQKLHSYENPNYRSQHGFNITHLNANGYFVLLPDIAYVTGDPGTSAAECVEDAVKSVIGKGLVDSLKIGLIGHSFGAYEVNFIITNSSLFAAAVSGAGISDNIRAYFTVNSEFLNAEIWRFENQQYRMRASFYEEKEAYLRNSPLLNADRITTPILIWTGKDDHNVKPEQSTAFYLALRRLGKQSIMFQYPNEGHILKSADAREDLNERIMDWFDFYLKGNKSKKWISGSSIEKNILSN